MRSERIEIAGIPAVIYGGNSDKAYLYVHGKMSCKESAEQFAEIAETKGYQTLSFDLSDHGERKGRGESCDIWSGMQDLNAIADYAFPKWNKLNLFCCSLGAYFALNSYNEKNFGKCLFLSPIVDMEYLVKQMMLWFDVSEERLEKEKLIDNPVDPLRWDYYQYIKAHPINKWDIPTHILHGSLDNLQSIDVVKNFSERFDCKLTDSIGSEHPFMAPRDINILKDWFERYI